jgi:hypothetical protein
MTRVGTSYFVSVRAANRYYEAYGFGEQDVKRKIIDNEIHIGKPILGPGERLTIVDNETGKAWDGRYAIEEAT